MVGRAAATIVLQFPGESHCSIERNVRLTWSSIPRNIVHTKAKLIIPSLFLGRTCSSSSFQESPGTFRFSWLEDSGAMVLGGSEHPRQLSEVLWSSVLVTKCSGLMMTAFQMAPFRHSNSGTGGNRGRRSTWLCMERLFTRSPLGIRANCGG